MASPRRRLNASRHGRLTVLKRMPTVEGMEMVPLTFERKAQLAQYTQRHGQDLAAALDDVLEQALDLDDEDYRETVAAVNEAYASVEAGRTRPASEFLEHLRLK